MAHIHSPGPAPQVTVKHQPSELNSELLKGGYERDHIGK